MVDDQKDTIRTLRTKLKAKKELHENQVNTEDDDDESVSDGSSDNDILPDPIKDPTGLYCCVECSFEVVDGECQSCFTPHTWTMVRLSMQLHLPGRSFMG